MWIEIKWYLKPNFVNKHDIFVSDRLEFLQTKKTSRETLTTPPPLWFFWAMGSMDLGLKILNCDRKLNE
jgi:hypothetical protein